MKRFLTFLLPALMLFAAGCKDKNLPEELPQTLSVNPELITCPDAGGDYTLTLTSPNGAWSAATNESWIRVTPTSGEKGTAEVRIKISPNKESAETKGEVTFTSGNETLQLPITRRFLYHTDREQYQVVRLFQYRLGESEQRCLGQ